jgi:hypothetical protein
MWASSVNTGHNQKRCGAFPNQSMIINTIFHSTDEMGTIGLPNQVFRNPDFKFLVTVGGHLVDDYIQYHVFMQLLQELGEETYTVECKSDSFRATISTKSKLEDFDFKIWAHDQNWGMLPYDWLVYGSNDSWGIYISEHPFINVIGCYDNLVTKFRSIFNIEHNGYDQVKMLLNNEFADKPQNLDSLRSNYKLR